MRKRLAWLSGILVASLALTVLAADVGLPEEFSDYHRWHRANLNKSFEESAHPVMKDIYFNEAAAEGFSDGKFSFPHAEGSIFVKESLDPETLVVQVLTVMRKVEGFDPGNGDWQYGMWERAGLDSDKENGDTSNNGDMNGGRLGGLEGGWMEPEAASMCIGCHTSVADSDYTFLTYLSNAER